MKKAFLICGLVALAVLAMGAVISRPEGHSTSWQTLPAYVPNSPADVVAQSVYVEEITLTNASDSSVSVTVNDKQSSPLPYLSAVAIAARTTYVIDSKGRYFPGGVSWSATAANAVVGYVSGYY